MFAVEDMRFLKPFRAAPVPVAEQKEELKRLKDVIRGHADQRLTNAAETLRGLGLSRVDILDMLNDAFGPNYREDDEHQQGDGILLIAPRFKAALSKVKSDYTAGTIAPEVQAVFMDMFGPAFFTWRAPEDEETDTRPN
jgi:hypothetical protein